MRPFFITAAGTNVGKTLIITALCWQLRQEGKNVAALKPIISGYDVNDSENDAALILRSCGLNPTAELMATIAPWRFAAPLSPSMAAAREDKIIDTRALVDFCCDHAVLGSDVLLAEGVGAMTPLGKNYTVADWMAALGWPAIMIAGSYLGALSHTLTACEVLATRGIPLRALVVCESEGSGVSLEETAAELETFLPAGIPVVKIPRIATTQETWKHVPLISWLCDI